MDSDLISDVNIGSDNVDRISLVSLCAVGKESGVASKSSHSSSAPHLEVMSMTN